MHCKGVAWRGDVAGRKRQLQSCKLRRYAMSVSLIVFLLPGTHGHTPQVWRGEVVVPGVSGGYELVADYTAGHPALAAMLGRGTVRPACQRGGRV